MQSLRSARLYEQLAEKLRDQIVKGELKLGQKLPTEREIAAQYGVSRNVVREAVRTLANDGLVQARQGSGVYVADGASRALSDSIELAITLGDATRKFGHLTEIRQLVEPGVAALAAERATSQDLELLRKEVAVMEDAANDVQKFITADHRFHVAIAKASGNPLVPAMLDPIVELLHEQRQRLFFVEHSASTAQDFHRQILAAIENRDSRGAFAAMRAHLVQVSGDIERLARKS